MPTRASRSPASALFSGAERAQVFPAADKDGPQRKAAVQKRQVRRAARGFWPDSREVLRWSAQDCMPADGVPYIGPFSHSRPSWFVATGFQKWGMTSAMVSAMVICDAILGKKNDWAPVFSPLRRPTGPALRAMASDGLRSAKELGRQIFSFPGDGASSLPAGHGGVVELHGGKAGVYRDGTGQLHAVSTRCPHMGCQLSWDPDERTWDCPCHGSRFDADGKRICGPAQTAIKE